MRFISKYGRYAVQIRPRIEENYATGMMNVLQEGIYARFEPMKLQPMERELAIAHWTFNGFYQEEDEVTIVPPDYRIGLFDSLEGQQANAWPDEIREQVELELQRLAETYDDILVVPRTMVPAPWPNYDSFRGSQAQLMRKLVDDGHDLETVLAYERESQNRADVVQALEELIRTADEIPIEEEVVG